MLNFSVCIIMLNEGGWERSSWAIVAEIWNRLPGEAACLNVVWKKSSLGWVGGLGILFRLLVWKYLGPLADSVARSGAKSPFRRFSVPCWKSFLWAHWRFFGRFFGDFY